VWAVVPLKNVRSAKQRLAPLLAPNERGQLMLAMVGDVLHALTHAPDLAGILLVSRAPEAADLAHQFGCELYAEAAGADLSESVQAAGVVRVLRAFGLLETLDSLVPEASSHPMELLKKNTKIRRRASSSRTVKKDGSAWVWEDEK